MSGTSDGLVEEIRRVAKLAMLELNEDEIKHIGTQFKNILISFRR